MVADGCARAFLLGQVIRYSDRAGEKDGPATDLGKANNYAHRLVTGEWRGEDGRAMSELTGLDAMRCELESWRGTDEEYLSLSVYLFERWVLEACAERDALWDEVEELTRRAPF